MQDSALQCVRAAGDGSKIAELLKHWPHNPHTLGAALTKAHANNRLWRSGCNGSYAYYLDKHAAAAAHAAFLAAGGDDRQRFRAKKAPPTWHADMIAAASGPNGIGISDHYQYGTPDYDAASKRIGLLVNRGHLVRRQVGRKARYFSGPDAARNADAWQSATVRKSLDASRVYQVGDKPRPSRVAMQTAEVIMPEHVKVQVCPCGKDHRFTVRPGELSKTITQDWMARRKGQPVPTRLPGYVR